MALLVAVKVVIISFPRAVGVVCVSSSSNNNNTTIILPCANGGVRLHARVFIPGCHLHLDSDSFLTHARVRAVGGSSSIVAIVVAAGLMLGIMVIVASS